LSTKVPTKGKVIKRLKDRFKLRKTKTQKRKTSTNHHVLGRSQKMARDGDTRGRGETKKKKMFGNV